MTTKEKEIRKWFTNNWINLDPLNRTTNWLTRDKVRVVVLRDEINRFLQDKDYCGKLEKRIEKLLNEVEKLEKIEDIDNFSDPKLQEQIPALDKILMRLYGFEDKLLISERQLKELNEWREKEKNGTAYTGRF